MARQILLRGSETAPSDFTLPRDSWWTAAGKVNEMTTELYAFASDTISAGWTEFAGGATIEARIALADAACVSQGKSLLHIPLAMLPYDITLCPATTTVRRFREGGDASVYDWRAYGADPDGILDALASAQASADGAEVTSGTSYAPPGTYALGPSDGAVPPVAGDYSLKLGSGVQLELAPGAVIVRRHSGGGAVNATIRNKDLAAGNSDIGLIGGTIKSINAANVGKHVGFTRVTRFQFWDTKLRGVVGDWNVSLNVTDATIRGLIMDSSASITNDGLHIVGGSRITVEGCAITCGDDCISVYPDQDGNQGNISDVTIRGIVCSSAASNCIRVGVPVGATELVQRVSVCDINGTAGTTGSGTGITIIDSTATARVRDIMIEHVMLDCALNGGACVNIDDAERVTLRDATFLTPASRIEIDGGSDIALDSVRVLSPRGGAVQCLLVASSKAVSRLHIRGGDYVSATTHGIELGTAGFAVTDFDIMDVMVRGSTNDGIRIRNGNGGRVIGCRSRDNGSVGIEEVAPSDFNLIHDNDVRTNTGGAVILAGANTEAGRNIGADGTMQGRRASGMITLTDAATIVTDASKGNHFKVTVAASRVFGAPTNATRGQPISYTIIQDGTGGWNITWNAVFKVSWSDTGNTLNKRSSISFVYDGTNWNQTGAQTAYV